ncbi:urease-enhancing factor [Helicobacter pylori]|nr:urease-enhancing factor [Helicobacter pylori]
MKTIRNSVFIGASLLGGCASIKTHFDFFACCLR